MKHLDPLEEKLREKLPPMRPLFRRDLRAHLIHQAEQQFTQVSGRASVLSFIFIAMKRYSIPALAGLTVLVFGIITFFPKNSVVPLGPEEVLAQVQQNYQQSEEGIYYEKVLTEHFENGQVIDSRLDESYKTADDRRYLGLTLAPETGELRDVFMRLTDEFGDVQLGYFSPEKSYYSEQDLPYENSEDDPWFNEVNSWFESFRGEKIYCVQRLEDDASVREVFLTLSADDYSVYKVDGTSVLKSDLSEKYTDRDKLVDFAQNENLVKDYIQDLIVRQAYDHSIVTEDDQLYHLFKMPVDPDYTNDTTWFYISAETNELEYYDIYFGTQYMSRHTVVERGYFDEYEYPDLFDPTRFEGLEMHYELEVGSSLHDLQESGCYDNWGDKLDDSILSDLPAEAIEAWEELVNMMEYQGGDPSGAPQQDYCGKNCVGPEPDMTQLNEELMQAEEFTNTINLEVDSAHMPSLGKLTQGYRAGHLAWDFGQKEGEDQQVYSVLSGEVAQAQLGWNGGYGNMIMITHDDGLQTLYAHLNEVNVEVGQMVSEGQVIGTMGRTGRTVGNGVTLHFELIQDGIKINPKSIF